MQPIGQLAVRVKVVEPDDSIAKAAEAVRASHVGAVPVIEDGRLIGQVTADLLADYLMEVGPMGIKALTIADLPLVPLIALPESLAPSEALLFFQTNALESAAVVDNSAGFLGLITRAELVSAVCGAVRPPLIGGMATPFGVYLTGGGVRGGVGDFALVTTGIYLASLQAVALLVSEYLFAAPSGVVYQIPALAERLPAVRLPVVDLSLVVFAILFRLSWITGYHAAEHQVVHTIEAGDELSPEVVRRKPREHPRCGTNLVAAVMIMTFFWTASREVLFYPWLATPLSWIDALNPVLAMLVTFFYWRRFGGWIQRNITTRPATPRQIDSGIAAGRQLMERYQLRAIGRRRRFDRVWNMGLLQVLMGWFFVLGLISLLGMVLPIPESLKLL